MTHKKAQPRSPEPETLAFHREMYERRLRKFKQRGGLSEREISERINSPQFRKPSQAAQQEKEAERLEKVS